jgi:hypothetical protein
VGRAKRKKEEFNGRRVFMENGDKFLVQIFVMVREH